MAGAFGGGTIDTRTTTQNNTNTDEVTVDQGEGGAFGDEDSQTTITEVVSQESGAGTQVEQSEGGAFDEGNATTTIIQPSGESDAPGIAVDQAQGGVFDGGGPTGTIASARGPTGAMGIQGTQGIQGTMGIQGIQGIQGTTGVGANSWIDYAGGNADKSAITTNGDTRVIPYNKQPDDSYEYYRQVVKNPTIYTDIFYSDSGLTTELTRR